MSRPLFLALLLLSGCSAPSCIPPIRDLVKLEVAHAAELGDRYDLTLERSSTLYSDGIEALYLKYRSDDLLDIAGARELVVDFVGSLIRAFDEELYLTSELVRPPLSTDQIDLLINFDSFAGKFIDSQYVGEIRLKGGRVSYLSFSAFDQSVGTFGKHEEAYSIAEVNVQAARAAKKRAKSAPKEGPPSSLSFSLDESAPQEESPLETPIELETLEEEILEWSTSLPKSSLPVEESLLRPQGKERSSLFLDPR